jgi:hypothetical protein
MTAIAGDAAIDMAALVPLPPSVESEPRSHETVIPPPSVLRPQQIKKKDATMIKAKKKLTPIRKAWMTCTSIMTWWIPSVFLKWAGMPPHVQQAWREKVALNLLILLACAVFLFYIIGLGIR